jgi:hypothetical protein
MKANPIKTQISINEEMSLLTDNLMHEHCGGLFDVGMPKYVI